MSENKQEEKKSYTPGIIGENTLPGYEVIGIKRIPSKNGDRIYTSYFCRKPFTSYEIDNAQELQGCSVEEVQTTEDFPIQIGDVVKFYYGKALGNWQPVVDFKIIKAAVK